MYQVWANNRQWNFTGLDTGAIATYLHTSDRSQYYQVCDESLSAIAITYTRLDSNLATYLHASDRH